MKFKSILFSLVFLLSGCAQHSPLVQTAPGSTSNSDGKVTLQLSNAKVVWQENPNLEIHMNQTVPIALSRAASALYEVKGKGHLAQEPRDSSTSSATKYKGIHPQAVKDSEKYVGGLVAVQRQFAATLLSKGLQAAGVQPGETHVITITPVEVFHSVDGWGTNLVMRTSIVDAENKQWVLNNLVKTGIHLTGVANARMPDEKFAQAFANDVLESLTRSNVLKLR